MDPFLSPGEFWTADAREGTVPEADLVAKQAKHRPFGST